MTASGGLPMRRPAPRETPHASQPQPLERGDPARARVPFLAAHACTALIVAALIAATLVLNAGMFTYTLDDPYIHLSLSEQIRAGRFGVNPGEWAAPSSSILFPFLLAPAARSAVHAYLPLLFNLASLFATLAVLRRYVSRLGFAADSRGAWVIAALTVLALIALNVIGLVMSGMEHSAHILLTTAIVYGLIVFLEDGSRAGVLAALVVVAPLLRYEALPLSAAVLGVLGLRGEWKKALLAGGAIAASLGAYSAFLLSLGLQPLPSSVLSKSNVAVNGVQGGALAFAVSLLRSVFTMWGYPVGMLLQLCAVGAAVRIVLGGLARGAWVVLRARERDFLLALVLIAVVVGHALGGRIDGFRYEVYAILAVLLLGLALYREALARALASVEGRRLVGIGGAALLCVIGVRYIRATVLAPIAANNIYEQQYQMHRFLTEFHRRPAAVNDLGWTSYRNDVDVVDFWGLGSERSRELQRERAHPDAYRELALEHGADLAIMYDDVLGEYPPASWPRLATLYLSRTRITPALERVDFYALDPARAPALREELRAWAPTLPPGVVLEFREGTAAQ